MARASPSSCSRSSLPLRSRCASPASCPPTRPQTPYDPSPLASSRVLSAPRIARPPPHAWHRAYGCELEEASHCRVHFAGASVILRGSLGPDIADAVAPERAARQENVARVLDEQRARRLRNVRVAQQRKIQEKELADAKEAERLAEENEIRNRLLEAEKVQLEQESHKELSRRARRLSVIQKLQQASRAERNKWKHLTESELQKRAEESKERAARRRSMARQRQDREKRQAQEAFKRYDEDGSGTLEYEEFTAVLDDLGLRPRTRQEKVVVRRVLENVIRGVDDDADSDGVPCSTLSVSNRSPRIPRPTSEEPIYTLEVGFHQADDLLTRIRAGLWTCRQRENLTVFSRVAGFATDLDLAGVRLSLALYGLTPADEAEEATFGRIALEFDQDENDGHGSTRGPCFDLAGLQMLVAALREAREQRTAEEQRRLAEELGVSADLLIKYRKELVSIRTALGDGQESSFGLLRVCRALEALGSLPLGLAATHCITSLVLRALHTSDKDDPAVAPPPSTRHKMLAHKRRSMLLAVLAAAKHTEEQKIAADGDMDVAAEAGSGGSRLYAACNAHSKNLKGGLGTLTGKLSFNGFLKLLTRLRDRTEQLLLHEYADMFSVAVASYGEHCQVLPMPDVFDLLEAMGLAPKSQQDQDKIKDLLERLDDWGFDHPTVDRNAFARLVREVHEVTGTEWKAPVMDAAIKALGMCENRINQCWYAFDKADWRGTGQLSFSGAQRAVRTLGLQIPEEHLEGSLEHLGDRSQAAVLITDFLRLVRRLDGQCWKQGGRETLSDSDSNSS